MWKVIATPKINGNLKEPLVSIHKTKEEAQYSKKCCVGRFPFGNRVKIVEDLNKLR